MNITQATMKAHSECWNSCYEVAYKTQTGRKSDLWHYVLSITTPPINSAAIGNNNAIVNGVNNLLLDVK